MGKIVLNGKVYGGDVDSVNSKTGVVVLDGTEINVDEAASTKQTVKDALGERVRTSSVGVANGVAGLGSDGKVPTSQLPDISGGTVKKVNQVSPDANGNVALDATKINVDDSAQTKVTLAAALGGKLDSTAIVQTTGTSEGNVMSQKAVTDLVAGLEGLQIEVVATLPPTGESGILYLVGTAPPYTEYVWVNGAFEDIGTTDIDLSGYVQKRIESTYSDSGYSEISHDPTDTSDGGFHYTMARHGEVIAEIDVSDRTAQVRTTSSENGSRNFGFGLYGGGFFANVTSPDSTETGSFGVGASGLMTTTSSPTKESEFSITNYLEEFLKGYLSVYDEGSLAFNFGSSALSFSSSDENSVEKFSFLLTENEALYKGNNLVHSPEVKSIAAVATLPANPDPNVLYLVG